MTTPHTTHTARALSCACLITLCALLIAAPAHADRGETHDGFFLRLSTGIGYGNIKGDNDNSKITGPTGQGSIAIGGIVTNNLALHADFFGATLFNPTYEDDNGNSVTINNRDITMRVAGLGIGVTYYIMPSNLYISGSIGAAFATTEVRGSILGRTFTRTWKSKTGFGLNLMFGKEWWVSGDWGLGVAGQLIYANIPMTNENSTDDAFSGVGLGVLFSATYN